MPAGGAVTRMNLPKARDRSGPGTLRACFLLLALLTMFAAMVEIGVRILIPRISRIEGRTVNEYNAVLAPASGKPLLLFVGNSLLDAPVDMPRVREASL